MAGYSSCSSHTCHQTTTMLLDGTREKIKDGDVGLLFYALDQGLCDIKATLGVG
jgi:hypothetical protein